MTRLFTLAAVVNLLSVLVMGSTQVGAQATSSKEIDLRRRQLHTMAECLEQSVIDEDDEISDFGDLFDNNEDEREVIVVGFDRDAGNGVMTCETALRQGIAVLEPSVSNWQDWLVEELTGTTFQEEDGPIPNGPIEGRRNALRGRVIDAMNAIPGPNSALRQARFYPLVSICYTFDESRDRSLGSNDFEVPGLGSFFLRPGDDVINSIDQFVSLGSNINPGDRANVGDIELGWYDSSRQSTFDTATSDFYPIGEDIAQPSGYTHDAIVDCRFVRENQDIIFAGVTNNGDDLTPPAGLDPTGPSGNPDEDGEPTDDSCESKSGAMGWILCPVINMLDGVLNWVDTQINALLEIDGDKYTNEGIQQAWSSVRNIAYIILVPIVLVMVISTALGFDFVSAYTVKRALPRLVAAVIFIALSWNIVVFLVGFSNAVGSGTLGIVTAPFREQMGASCQDTMTLACFFDVQSGVNGGSILRSILLLPQAAISIVGILVFLVLYGQALLLAIGIAFLVLLTRQMFIIALMIVAPLAILAWIFPGNDKLWKSWWSIFSKLLMMYPLIMLLIGVGRVFAWVLRETGGGQLDGAVLNPILVLGAYMIPYALIPLTYKFAGGTFALLTGGIDNRSKGMFAKMKEKRGERVSAVKHRAESNNLFGGAPEGSQREKWNKGAAYAANIKKAGLRPSLMKGNLKRAVSGSHHLEHALEQAEKLPGAPSHFANDNILMAGLEGEGDVEKTKKALGEQKIYGTNAQIALAEIMSLRKEMGAEGYTLAALAKLPGTGTSFEEEQIGDWHKKIAKHTHGNTLLQGSIVAAGKAGFRQALRTEVSEAGFGDHMTAIKMAEADPNVATKDITEFIVDKAYAGGGASAVIGTRNQKSAKMFAEAANRSLDNAKNELATPGANVEQKTRELRQKQATVAAIHDQIGSAKQIVGEVLADKVFGREGQTTVSYTDPAGKTVTSVLKSAKTQLQEIEGISDEREFREMKKVYGMTAAERAEAARRGEIPFDTG